MKDKNIVVRLSPEHPSFVYTMTKKERVTIGIVIVSSVSFHADARIVMDAKAGSAIIHCLVIPQNNAAITLQTQQTHNAPDATSNLLVKSLVMDAASVVFRGNVHIAALAKGSDAYQKNENLLIGNGGAVTAMPTLEILNHDVKCSHGATIATIPDLALWYMKTRGISETKAKELYMEGFIYDSMFSIQGKPMQELIHAQMEPHI